MPPDLSEFLPAQWIPACLHQGGDAPRPQIQGAHGGHLHSISAGTGGGSHPSPTIFWPSLPDAGEGGPQGQAALHLSTAISHHLVWDLLPMS